MNSTYQKNNIMFRIASAEAISNFKAAQSAAFIQLARKELGFDESAKESILLEYDRFSHWALKIEKICLSAAGKSLGDTVIKIVSGNLMDELSIIESVMDRHPNIFNGDVSPFVKMIHHYASDIILKSFDDLVDERVDAGFLKIIDIVSNYLRHLLLAFHEYNNNIISKTDAPFVCGSGFSTETQNPNFTPVLNRANFYIDRGVGRSFIFKNYSAQPLYGMAVDYFDQLNITMIPEEEILKDPA